MHPGARGGHRPHDAPAHRVLRRHRGGRRLPQQLPVHGRHAPRRPHALRPRVLRRQAALLDRLSRPSRRCRRADPVDLPALRQDDLRGGAALPRRPRGTRLQGASRHHPHGEDESAGAGSLVRRLPRAGGRLPHRRAPHRGTGGEIRAGDHRPVRRGLDGLRRAPRRRRHQDAPGRLVVLREPARSAAGRRRRGYPGSHAGHGRPRRSDHHGGRARQHRLHPRRAEPERDLRHRRLPRRRFLQHRPHHPAQRGQRAAHPRAAARWLHRRPAALPSRHLGRHHQRHRPAGERRLLLLRADRAGARHGGGRLPAGPGSRRDLGPGPAQGRPDLRQPDVHRLRRRAGTAGPRRLGHLRRAGGRRHADPLADRGRREHVPHPLRVSGACHRYARPRRVGTARRERSRSTAPPPAR